MPEQRPPRKYEPQVRHIVTNEGIEELIDWMQKNCTENEWVWWWSRYMESVTGEQITNELDEAALGYNEANAIRVAGHRYKERLVKAFLGTNQEQ